MTHISLLSLTASDNEGQFKNHVQIVQPHTHTAECPFHLNASTCVSKESSKGTKQKVGFYFLSQDVEDFAQQAVTFHRLSFI